MFSKENPVCTECRTLTSEKFFGCREVCSHVISWHAHQAASRAINVALEHRTNWCDAHRKWGKA